MYKTNQIMQFPARLKCVSSLTAASRLKLQQAEPIIIRHTISGRARRSNVGLFGSLYSTAIYSFVQQLMTTALYI